MGHKGQACMGTACTGMACAGCWLEAAAVERARFQCRPGGCMTHSTSAACRMHARLVTATSKPHAVHAALTRRRRWLRRCRRSVRPSTHGTASPARMHATCAHVARQVSAGADERCRRPLLRWCASGKRSAVNPVSRVCVGLAVESDTISPPPPSRLMLPALTPTPRSRIERAQVHGPCRHGRTEAVHICIPQEREREREWEQAP